VRWVRIPKPGGGEGGHQRRNTTRGERERADPSVAPSPPSSHSTPRSCKSHAAPTAMLKRGNFRGRGGIWCLGLAVRPYPDASRKCFPWNLLPPFGQFSTGHVGIAPFSYRRGSSSRSRRTTPAAGFRRLAVTALRPIEQRHLLCGAMQFAGARSAWQVS
jgi:hypothetical protein